MSKEGSVAPKERVNIVYKPATGQRAGGGRAPAQDPDDGRLHPAGPTTRPLEDRKPINVDKDNFNKVMAEQKLELRCQRSRQALRARPAPRCR